MGFLWMFWSVGYVLVGVSKINVSIWLGVGQVGFLDRGELFILIVYFSFWRVVDDFEKH